MERDHIDDDLIEFGSVSTETKGGVGLKIDGEGIFGVIGLSDD